MIDCLFRGEREMNDAGFLKESWVLCVCNRKIEHIMWNVETPPSERVIGAELSADGVSGVLLDVRILCQ